MKVEEKHLDKQGVFVEEPKDKCRNVPSDFTIGGPFSAFSGIGNSVNSVGSLKPEYIRPRPVSPMLRSPLGGHMFPSESFFSRQSRPDTASDMPIAPAFAQIFQRRRRRENRPRRQRTTFTSEQTLKLELEYNRADYITRPRRFELAEMLTLSENQIKIWFQNRRAKDKRIEKAHMDHQLRSMGINSMPGLLPVPFPCTSLCGTCGVPPSSLPVPVTPVLYSSSTPKALKLM